MNGDLTGLPAAPLPHDAVAAPSAPVTAPASRDRRKALRRMGAVVLSFPALPALAAGVTGAATIVAVRVWPASDYTRVTIESDRQLAARSFMAANPDRLVIDIDGLELNAGLKELLGKVKPDDPYIAGVRVGQNQPRVVRIVLDLKQAVAPQVFTIEPVAAYKNRLVLDLHPTRELGVVRPALGCPNASGRECDERTSGASFCGALREQAIHCFALRAAGEQPRPQLLTRGRCIRPLGRESPETLGVMAIVAVRDATRVEPAAGRRGESDARSEPGEPSQRRTAH